MPIKYRIDSQTSTVLYRLDGDATLEAATTSSSAVVEDPEYRSGMNGIADLRGMTIDTDVSGDTIRSLSSFNQSFADDALSHPRMAIVAGDDLAFGIARMYEAYADSLPTEYLVTRDMAEACKWVGVPIEIWDSIEGWKTAE